VPDVLLVSDSPPLSALGRWIDSGTSEVRDEVSFGRLLSDLQRVPTAAKMAAPPEVWRCQTADSWAGFYREVVCTWHGLRRTTGVNDRTVARIRLVASARDFGAADEPPAPAAHGDLWAVMKLS
jgi:hypothetical protein